MAIFVLYNKGLPVHITSESPYTGTPELKKFEGVEYDEVKTAGRLDSMKQAEEAAVFATESTGRQHIAYDDGEWTSHRFGIMEPPKVGDDVSYGFNGDYYPCGKIVKITKGWRITTSEGKVFNRARKVSAAWLMVGGTWSMVKGTINERNPSF